MSTHNESHVSIIEYRYILLITSYMPIAPPSAPSFIWISHNIIIDISHICVCKLTAIGSDNCLSPGRCQAIIWTNAGILLIGPLGINFSKIFIKISTFSFKKMDLKMSTRNGGHLVPASMCSIPYHDDVIKWKHFPRNWPFVREIHRSPVNFPHKGQWRGALMFSLIYAWINDWVNNREAGDLRRQHGHYDVIVMEYAGGWCCCACCFVVVIFSYITHLSLDKMAAISLTIFSDEL